MKKTLLLLMAIFFASCDGLRGWFPGYTDQQPTKAPSGKGCNKDLIVHYKNNCAKQLIMYFSEIIPGANVPCESLSNLGSIAINETKTITVHKGKIGYFAFAEDIEGKCNQGHRKADAWVNCEQSTSDEVTFTVCQ